MDAVNGAPIVPLLPLALAAALVHVAAIVGGVAWLGTLATRVAPASGAASVDASLLCSRLLALPALGVPATVSDPSPDELVVDYRFADAARSHRVTLLVGAPQRRVRVFERTGARVDLARARPDSLDLDDLVTLLCAVVTGSGWAWQPAWPR